MNIVVAVPDLLRCISEAIDMTSPVLRNHHRRVMRISYDLSVECGFGESMIERILVAAAVHDIGAFMLRRREILLNLDMQEDKHAHYGAELIGRFRPFREIAPIIEHHHLPWSTIASHKPGWELVPFESQVLHLADRISVLIDEKTKLHEVPDIVSRIDHLAPGRFNGELVERFHAVAKRESFWLDARDATVPTIAVNASARSLILTPDDLSELGKIFRQFIDFRSTFTATHTAGVATVAQALSEICNFSAYESVLMKFAGDLHDIGKLAIPVSILEKKGSLTDEEMGVMKSHTYYGNRLLQCVSAFDTVRKWGALHHEKLNGTGYPFHLTGDQLPLGSRIMAVADIFTATLEDRPYRKGMDVPTAQAVLDNMVKTGGIDGKVVKQLRENFEEINQKRIASQAAAAEEYGRYLREVKNGA